MIAAVAAVIPALIARSAGAGASATAANPPDSASRVANLIADNMPRSVVVRFANHRWPPVRIVRGAIRVSAGSGTGETVVPARSRVSPVAVMRGGDARSSASPRHAGVEIVVAFANSHEAPVTVLHGMVSAPPDIELFAPAGGLDLDRVAFAVDGAESSHGMDPRMWRPELDGPQGPMQVSAAAALDSGGGDRFDLGENRALGRAYLALLYRRYGNWPDTIAAYNWGPGNLDAWIGAGRPAAGLPLDVEQYRNRVMRDSSAPPAPGRQ
jgi:hypothetical protein